MWFLEQLDAGRGAYNLPCYAYLTGPLRRDILDAAFSEIVRRHEVLRTAYPVIDGEPVAVITPPERIEAAYQDLRGLPKAARDAEVRRLADEEICIPFDLRSGPVFRYRLLALDDTEHAALLTFHHIAVDRWSLAIFTEELAHCYEALSTGQQPVFAPVAFAYEDYAFWEQSARDTFESRDHLTYWRRHLDGFATLALPCDRPRPPVPTGDGRRFTLSVEPHVVRALRGVGRRHGATPFVTLLSAFYALLSRYTGSNDIVVGTPVAGRSAAASADIIGLFVNTLALRANLDGDPTFRELLQRVKAVVTDGYAHQDTPFDRVVQSVCPERIGERTLVDVMFAMEETFGAWRNLGDVRMRPLEIDTLTAKFDVMLECRKRDDGGIDAVFEYRTASFDDATIARLAANYHALLESVVRDPLERLSRLKLAGGSVQSAGSAPMHGLGLPAVDGAIHERFETWVRKTPDAPAVVEGTRVVTYAECNERANRLAAKLVGAGVTRGAIVGLCAERSADAIIGMLGILKAGAAYLPLDATYPADRIAYMLADSRAAVVVADEGGRSRVASSGVAILDLHASAMPDTEVGLAAVAAEAGDRAYVMYTSGSTGRPKGVVIPHRGVTDLVVDTNYVSISASDCIAQTATLSFDLATFEIWGALLNGAHVIVCPQETVLSPDAFATFLRRNEITMLFLTTALFHMIARQKPGAFAGLQTLMVGGEALDPHLARTVLERGRPHRFVNAYGPTETTTLSCTYDIEHVPESAQRIPIGHAVARARTYVLDLSQRVVPTGVPGELVIGGPGVGDGYLHDPERTAERFIRDPFSDDPAERLYRTGDRVVMRDDGVLDCLGRFDRQVKIRGFRIELGEIEAALRDDPRVEACIAVVRGDAEDRRLEAFAVARESAGAVDAASVKQTLALRLPHYMVPASVAFVERFPLDPNGKIDTHALTADIRSRAVGDDAGPTTILHYQLIDLWQRMLGVAPIGIHDDFFALGGHSLLAARMMEQIEHVCGERLPLAELFGKATIAHLADALVNRVQRSARGQVIVLHESGAQPPLFFLHGSLGGDGFYCRSLARALGPEQPFYALAPHGLDGQPLPPTIEAMADDFIAMMRRVRPHGPYRLGGYCSGGLVAFEMARRLGDEGERVDGLVLIDTVPYAAKFRWLERTLAPLPLDLWKRQRLLAAGSRRIDAVFSTVRSGKPEAWRKLRSDLRPDRSVRTLATEDARADVELEERVRVISRAYVPQRYRGEVGLLFSDEVRAACTSDTTLGWKALCTNVALLPIPGDHLTSVSLHTEAVAGRFRDLLHGV